jgi:soluble lytic murein transglycosylase-like protein
MIVPGKTYRLALLALAAPALVVAAAASASAQHKSPPLPPESTTMSAPSGGSLVRDFGHPPEAAKPSLGSDVANPAPPDTVTGPEPICTTGDPTVDAVVRQAAVRYGVDPCLVVAVMAQESGYRRYAVSPKGASGYMQLMPDTARRFGVIDLFDPQQNIHAGTRYLRFLLDRFGGSLELALAGYNAGEAAVEHYGMRIPPFAETQNYVRVISGRYLSHHAAKTDLRLAPGVAPPLPPPAPVAQGHSRPAVAWHMSVSFEPK